MPRSTCRRRHRFGRRASARSSSTAFDLYGRYWRTLIPLVAVVVVPLTILQYALDAVLWGDVVRTTTGGGVEVVASNEEVWQAAAGGLLLGLLTLFVTLVLVGAVAWAAAGALVGREPDLGESYRFGVARMWSVLLVSLLTGLAVAGGFILLVVPGLIFLTRFAVSVPALVVEGKRGRAALSRSWNLVTGHSWPVFGTLMVAGLIAGAVSGVLTVPFSGPWYVRGLLAGIGSAITTPFTGARVLARLLRPAGAQGRARRGRPRAGAARGHSVGVSDPPPTIGIEREAPGDPKEGQMDGVGYALVGLALGVALGAAVMATRRRSSQDGVGDVTRLEARLEVQSAELRRLADSGSVRDGDAERIRSELAGARQALQELALRDEERRERERDYGQVVRRLSTVLAGGSAKGRAGENVLREHLAELPPGMLVTDFRVNGKVVEFGLLLPDGRRLPVDSKWTALAELEALEAAEEPAEREARAREVEKAVAARAREVAQYLDPRSPRRSPWRPYPTPRTRCCGERTPTRSGAAWSSCRIRPRCRSLLFLHSLVSRYGDAGDVQAALQEVATILDVMEGVLENKFARAATMLANGTDEMRSQLGKARGSVARGRSSIADPDPVEGSPVLEAVR